jgi:hypothetical protein
VLLGGRRKAAAGAATPSALDELLLTEQEIAVQMAAAEKEAAALAAAAHGEAETIEREAAAALTAELAALDKSDETARGELVRKMEDEAARLVARYGALGDEEIARLAAFVVSEITGLAGESGR